LGTVLFARWIASRHVPCGRKDCARGRKDTVPSLRVFKPWPFIVNSDTASYSNGVSILITPWLDAFYSVKPDFTFPAQSVSFGTSGHRGSSLTQPIQHADACLFKGGIGL